jgi:hypothetical protein
MDNPTPPLHVEIEALVDGPLISQSAACARLAHILHHAAQDLWEAAALMDAAQMYEEARAAASRVLAACPLD